LLLSGANRTTSQHGKSALGLRYGKLEDYAIYLVDLFDRILPPVDCHITSNGHRDEKHGSSSPNSNTCAVHGKLIFVV